MVECYCHVSSGAAFAVSRQSSSLASFPLAAAGCRVLQPILIVARVLASQGASQGVLLLCWETVLLAASPASKALLTVKCLNDHLTFRLQAHAFKLINRHGGQRIVGPHGYRRHAGGASMSCTCDALQSVS